MQLLKLDSCVVAISYYDVEQFITVCVCTVKREQWKECKMEKAHTRLIHVPSRGAPTTSATSPNSKELAHPENRSCSNVTKVYAADNPLGPESSQFFKV